MNHASVTLPDKCGGCGARVDATHVQSCYSARLYYSFSYRCAACDRMIVADGVDAPEPVRKRFIADSGLWRVVVTEIGPRRPDVVRLIQEVTGGTFGDALRTAKSAIPFGAGTPVEMTCLADQLVRAGATARTEPATT